jgi:hypothetical protein
MQTETKQLALEVHRDLDDIEELGFKYQVQPGDR